MTKIKKSLLFVLSWLMVFCIGLCFTGCGEKDEKCDVTIRVKNNFGKEWVFTPDIEELTYEFEYTGKDMEFYVDAYKLTDEPDYTGDKWFEPSGEGANVFSKTMVYTDMDGKPVAGVRPVKEKGSYSICFEANATSNLWNFRAVYLNVYIK